MRGQRALETFLAGLSDTATGRGKACCKAFCGIITCGTVPYTSHLDYPTQLSKEERDRPSRVSTVEGTVAAPLSFDYRPPQPCSNYLTDGSAATDLYGIIPLDPSLHMFSAAQHSTCIDAFYSSACCLARATLSLHSQLSIDYQGSSWARTITALSIKLQCHLPSMRSS